MEGAQEKPARFRCPVCHQGFTRTDHLKRHQLRHSGIKPYVCTFCKDAFARVDSLRNHYSDCSQRGDQPIPETDQKGRRRHACELCISMKLRCEGDVPCRSCQKRGATCVRPPGIAAKALSETATTPSAEPQTPGRTPDRAADLGSIKFLLNNGTDGFIDDFRFPTRSTRLLVEHDVNTMVGPNGQAGSAQNLNDFVQGTMQAPMQPSMDPSDPELFDQNFYSLFEGPFGAFHQQWQDSLVGGTDGELMVPFASGPSPASSDASAARGPESILSAALIDALLSTLARMKMASNAQQAVAADIQFLCTPRRIRYFVAMYFKYWHPNCPIVHPATFEPEYAELPLLLSVFLMGAMYSHDERELNAAKRLLDVAEVWVFSIELFAPETEVCRTFEGTTTPSDERTDWTRFQLFQAGYLLVVTQYWTGSRRSKDRAMEVRFSSIVKVARNMGLTSCRHRLEDRISQELWIQRETRIRTMTIIWTLDCAFLFYQNYPCRLTFTELGFDLPCEESLFDSRNPFAEANFRFSREMTFQMAFEAILSADAAHMTATESSSAFPSSNWLGVTALDMFALMHALYYFIHVRMSLLIPLLPRTSDTTLMMAAANTGEGPIMTRISTALSCWKDLWIALRNDEPESKWSAPGLFKNSHSFWQVAQLLVSKKGSVDVIAFMEPKCEDKLERLKILV